MKSFRSEINGLRAIAVLAVLLFHARVPAFGGGFIGVDVFFVISGFLMTQIIMGGLARGDFSLPGFWAARARRIVPALLVLCAVLAALGWFLIDPITYAGLGTHVAASVAFVSNIQFWRESGYFDDAADTKWLLHSWTLSVEWQFYLLYPLVLLAARRLLGQRATVALLWLGFAASLALSVAVTAWRPSIAFYMLPTRAWEMIAGGLVSVHGAAAARLPAQGRRILEVAGLLVIAAAVATIRPSLPWPSGWALLPVAGTAAVIVADRRGASVLNLRPLQALGLWSYSIYLWHWPVIVAFRYYDWASSPWARPAEVALGIGLGALSTRFVEIPSRSWLARASFRQAAAAAVPAIAALMIWAAADIRGEGFTARARQPDLMADYVAARSDWVFPEGACERTGRDRSVHLCRLGTGRDTLVIGDSHANQWFARAADRGYADTFVTRDGCPPLPDVDTGPGADCPDFYRVALKAAREGHYKRVVFVAFWQSYFRPDAYAAGLCIRRDGGCLDPASRPDAVDTVFADFARDLKTIGPGTEIVLVLPDLEPPGDMPVLLAQRAFFGRDASDLEASPTAGVRAATAPMRAALERVARAVGARTVDPLDAECGPAECRFLDGAGRPLFRDSNHLRSSVVRARLDVLDPYLGSGAVAQAAAPEDDTDGALRLRPTQP